MLDQKRFGCAGGILGGLWFFFLTVLSLSTGYATIWLNIISDMYPGYYISWSGAFIGLLYGFLEGFVAMYLLAWLYNRVQK